MSVQPPPGSQYSADGRWRWDGTNWVPTTAMTPVSPAAPGAYPQFAPMPQAPNNSAATASLIVGILSWFMCPIVGAIAAVILGHMARGQIRRTGESGGGLAMAGLILGYAHLAVVGGFILLWFVVLGGMAAFLGVIGTLPVVSPSP